MTLFRITPEQLKVAEGQVRCCQCNQVFNAIESLQEDPAPFSNQNDSADAINGEITTQEHLAYHVKQQVEHDSALINDSEVERSLDDLADDSTPVYSYTDDSNLAADDQDTANDSQSQLLYEQDDGLETEPDYFASETESQMSELLDKDSASLLLDDKKPDSNLADIIELDIPEPEHLGEDYLHSLTNDSSELENKVVAETGTDQEQQPPIPDEPASQKNEDFTETEEPFTFEAQDDDKTTSTNSILWTIGSLLLLIPLCGQLAWQFKDNLIYHKTGRQLLDIVCSVAGCTTPLRIDLEKVLVTERSLTAHPAKQNTLAMQLEMVNTAPFEQPYPNLQLSLFNDMGTLVARRTFTRLEYYPEMNGSDVLMPKLRPIQIELELIDPGKEVTGFKFEFL
jgi:predicted Zn finger-like uncharacterized protein